MSKPITATQLRTDVYRILDQVLETGEPQEISRGNEKLVIVPMGSPRRRRLADRPKRNGIRCTLDELVGTSWEKEWNPDPA